MRIAYLTNCFGTQSHTFIRREIEQLRRANVDISLYGIHRDQSADELWQNETQYLYPLKTSTLIRCIAAYFCRAPIHFCKGIWEAFFSPELTLKRRAKMVFHFFCSTTIARALEKNGITHIHAHFMNVSASIAMYASHHTKIPFSITVHSAGTYGTPHIIGIAQKLTAAQHLVMISHYNISYFQQFAECKNKATVIRCGMDLENFPYAPAPPNNHCVKILAIGRFVEKKGFRYLIEAIHLINKQETATPVELAIIGSGPLEESLKALSKDTANITFLGQQNTAKVYEYLLASNIVVVPSVTSASGEMEGLPVVIMEAMATGRTVISTKHSGIPEIVKHGQTGYLVDEKDPVQLADAIIFASSTSPASADTIIDTARKLIETEFNIERVADQRKQLFKQLDSGVNID